MKTLIIISMLLSFNPVHVDSTDSTKVTLVQAAKAESNTANEDDDIEDEGFFYLLTAPVYLAIAAVIMGVVIVGANAIGK